MARRSTSSPEGSTTTLPRPTKGKVGGVGPVGFEPTTKGFTLPRSFLREWTISSPVRIGCACGCGMLVRLSSRALEPSGSLCTFRRCTGGSAQGCHGATAEGFPEFIPSTSRVSARRHLVDESPALTAVLQAQRNSIVTAADCGPGIRCGRFARQPSSVSAAIAITAVIKSDLMAIPSCHR